MSNTPGKAEIEALVKRHGATSYRNRADTQHPAYGFTEDGINGLIDEVLAKWGTPQPVVREPPGNKELQAISLEYSDSEDECTGFRDGWRFAEKHYGIRQKGGQHGTDN